MSPTKNPKTLTTRVTNQRFHSGNWSQIILIIPPVREVALPIPRVNNIRKKRTAKSC